MNKVILMGRLVADPEIRYTRTMFLCVASGSQLINQSNQRTGKPMQSSLKSLPGEVGLSLQKRILKRVCRSWLKGI